LGKAIYSHHIKQVGAFHQSSFCILTNSLDLLGNSEKCQVWNKQEMGYDMEGISTLYTNNNKSYPYHRASETNNRCGASRSTRRLKCTFAARRLVWHSSRSPSLVLNDCSYLSSHRLSYEGVPEGLQRYKRKGLPSLLSYLACVLLY
jgi:hypothetical protein